MAFIRRSTVYLENIDILSLKSYSPFMFKIKNLFSLNLNQHYRGTQSNRDGKTATSPKNRDKFNTDIFFKLPFKGKLKCLLRSFGNLKSSGCIKDKRSSKVPPSEIMSYYNHQNTVYGNIRSKQCISSFQDPEVSKLPYFFRYKTEFFSLPKQSLKSRSIL